MMFSSQPRCFDVDALEAARRQRLHRAGLRAAPCSGEPGGVFVAIEMAVLVFVSALAMVSVIVTTGSPAEAHGVEGRSDAVAPDRAQAGATHFARPSMYQPDRPFASRSARQ